MIHQARYQGTRKGVGGDEKRTFQVPPKRGACLLREVLTHNEVFRIGGTFYSGQQSKITTSNPKKTYKKMKECERYSLRQTDRQKDRQADRRVH